MVTTGMHCHPDQLPDENAVHPTVKDKDDNPMTVKDIRTRDHQRIQHLQDKATLLKSSGKKIGKLS